MANASASLANDHSHQQKMLLVDQIRTLEKAVKQTVNVSRALKDIRQHFKNNSQQLTNNKNANYKNTAERYKKRILTSQKISSQEIIIHAALHNEERKTIDYLALLLQEHIEELQQRLALCQAKLSLAKLRLENRLVIAD